MRALALAALVASAPMALAQKVLVRAAGGKWVPVAAKQVDGRIEFALDATLLAGGKGTIVIDPPSWMKLDDEQPPEVTGFALDGQPRELKGPFDLGHVARPPSKVEITFVDRDNPLDPASLLVRVEPSYPDRPQSEHRFTGGADRKQGTVVVTLPELPQDSYRVLVAVADASPQVNRQRVEVRFSTLPLILNGSFEQVTAEGKAANWSFGTWSSNAETKYKMEVVEGGVAGRRALRMEGLAGSLNMVCSQTTYDVTSGGEFVVTGSYRTDGGCGLSILAYDAGGKELLYDTRGLKPTKQWTAFREEFKVPPNARVVIAPRSGSKGVSWFDDLKMVPK